MSFPRPSHALKKILMLPGCWLGATLSAHPIRLEELLPMVPRILRVLTEWRGFYSGLRQ